MNILLAVDAVLPVTKYGGTERVVYSLGKALADMGHDITFLCRPGSECAFAKVIERNPAVQPEAQVPEKIDITHFNNYVPSEEWRRPYIVTWHGNGIPAEKIVANSVFVSRDHAHRHGCELFVYNGLDWDDYGKPDLSHPRHGFHFLGNAAWRVKNLKGAISTVKSLPGAEPLHVLGGTRLNFKMGFRFTLSPRIHFHGMVDNDKKREIITRSRGMVFPVRWHEPFGLCIIESLYFGSPVFGTPYGSLPELIKDDIGALADNREDMAKFLIDAQAHPFSPDLCHQYAADLFNARVMAEGYVKCYEKVLSGEKLIAGPVKPDLSDYRHLPWREHRQTGL